MQILSVSSNKDAQRVQARIHIPEEIGSKIDALRMQWNPELASNNPAHITVVYHDEAPDADLLRSRLERVCPELRSFNLRLGVVRRFDGPDAWAYIEVVDPGGGVAQLRDLLLGTPFTRRARFGLHVTLLHPSYGLRLADAWDDLSKLRINGEFEAQSIELITGRGASTEVLASYPFRNR